MVNYFFDTYALIELVKSNPSYAIFINEPVTTTKFNLAELFYILLEEFGEEKAKLHFVRFREFEVGIPDEILFKAVIFRLKNKKKRLSYADCIGYVFALESKLKFLTGDDAFKNMDNVEFVK